MTTFTQEQVNALTAKLRAKDSEYQTLLHACRGAVLRIQGLEDLVSSLSMNGVLDNEQVAVAGVLGFTFDAETGALVMGGVTQ